MSKEDWRETIQRRERAVKHILLGLFGVFCGAILEGLIINGFATRTFTGFWAHYAQATATIVGASIAVFAAGIALENGNRSRKQDRELAEHQTFRDKEKELRDRFHELVKLLSEDNYRTRESSAL